MITNKRLQEIKQRCDVATKGEWKIGRYSDTVTNGDYDVADFRPNNNFPNEFEENTIFAANAHQDIPYLLEYIEKLEQRIGECEASLAAMDRMLEKNTQLKSALEKIDALAKMWEGRNDAPFWNLGDIARNALKGLSTTCRWTQDTDRETNVWETECGNAMSFVECTPQESGNKFCQYCGKSIEFVEIEEGGGNGKM